MRNARGEKTARKGREGQDNTKKEGNDLGQNRLPILSQQAVLGGLVEHWQHGLWPAMREAETRGDGTSLMALCSSAQGNDL